MARETVTQLKTKVEAMEKRLAVIDPLYNGDATVRFIGLGLDSGNSIRYPRSGSGSAGFGDTIIDSDRAYAVLREPVAKRVTIDVANDVFDKWFTVDDPRTKGSDPDLDEKIQAILEDLQCKSILSEALAFERIYGYSIVVGAFDDAPTSEELAKELKTGSTLVDLAVYSKPMVTSIERDKDPDSMRFGLPVWYNVNRGSSKRLRIHYTRVLKVQTTSNETSSLDNIWDDLTNLRNIRWGMGQTMFRYGSGFPVLTLKNKTIEQLQAYADAGYFTNLMARTQLLKNEEMDIEFKGMQGAALNPEPYYTPIFEQLSIGSNIPKDILHGNQAGALTGSEFDERKYFKFISSIQSKSDFVRQLVQWIMPQAVNGGVDTSQGGWFHRVKSWVLGDAKPKEQPFKINWAPGFQPTEKEQAQTDLTLEQTKAAKLQYMTVDELREEEGLEPLPDGKGGVVPGLLKATQPQGGGGFGGAGEEGFNEGKPAGLLADVNTMSHPTLVSTLKDILQQVHDKQISKANALERGARIIKLFVTQEQDRAKAYVGSKARRVVSTLPYEYQRQFDDMMKQYLRDWETMVDDAIKATS